MTRTMNEVKMLLGGLDMAHAEMVHDRIVSDYML